MIQKTPLSY